MEELEKSTILLLLKEFTPCVTWPLTEKRRNLWDGPMGEDD